MVDSNKKTLSVEDDIVSEFNDRMLMHFKDICGVYPRRSKNEAAMCDFLKKFTEGLEAKGFDVTYTHKPETRGGKPINNVVITKAASVGYEELEPVILQAHLDMVCQKVEGSDHDFDTQGIEYEIVTEENEDIMISKNRETTLGADDGIGVACIMALLESNNLKHPKIEAVFTSDEEDGMSGAQNFNTDLVSGTRLINIDAETEGVLYYGCAGGIYAHVKIPLKYKFADSDSKFYKINISGLTGGHSGLEIDKNHANANRLMGRTLHYLTMEFGESVSLVSINGGNAKNAITKEAAAVVGINSTISKSFMDKIKAVEIIFKNEYQYVEKELSLTACQCEDIYGKVFTSDTMSNIVTAIMTIPNDVIAMHGAIDGLVETSANMGVIAQSNNNITLSSNVIIQNDNAITITSFIRSSIETKKLLVVEQIRMIAEGIGAEFIADTDFPEWDPNRSSKILKLFENTYKDIFDGQEAVSESVHAGLECGYFYKNFAKAKRSMDLIAIGPTITGAHTPQETLYLSSVKKLVKLLLTVLERMIEEEQCMNDLTCDCVNNVSKKRKIFNCNCMR